MTNGAQYVMMDGVLLMLLLSVNNLDMLILQVSDNQI